MFLNVLQLLREISASHKTIDWSHFNDNCGLIRRLSFSIHLAGLSSSNEAQRKINQEETRLLNNELFVGGDSLC